MWKALTAYICPPIWMYRICLAWSIRHSTYDQLVTPENRPVHSCVFPSIDCRFINLSVAASKFRIHALDDRVGPIVSQIEWSDTSNSIPSTLAISSTLWRKNQFSNQEPPFPSPYGRLNGVHTRLPWRGQGLQQSRLNATRRNLKCINIASRN